MAKKEEQEKSLKVNPDLLIPRELLPKDVALFGKLMQLALIADTSIIITFDTARFVSGDDLAPGGLMELSDTPPEKIRQEQQGFTIEVGTYGAVDEDGSESHFPSLGKAVDQGLQMLFQIITNDQGAGAATQIFGSQFKMK